MAHARDAGLLGSANPTLSASARSSAAVPCASAIGSANLRAAAGSGVLQQSAAAPEGGKDVAGKMFNVLPEPVLVSGTPCSSLCVLVSSLTLTWS